MPEVKGPDGQKFDDLVHVEPSRGVCTPDKPVRQQILQAAEAATMVARHAVYGDPYTDMNCAAEMEAVFRRHAGNRYGKAHDEAISRVFTKLARIACGVYCQDNYVDGAAYFAIAAEVHQQDETHWTATKQKSAADIIAQMHIAAKVGSVGSISDVILGDARTAEQCRKDHAQAVEKEKERVATTNGAATTSLRCVHCPDKDAMPNMSICEDCWEKAER